MFVILQITYICVSIAVIGIYSAEVADFAFLACAVVFNSYTMFILLHSITTQPVRLLVSAKAYQPANSVFLSQQTSTSTSRAYQPRNQPANRLTIKLV